MAIEFKCACGKSMKCKGELAGRRARCKGCGREFVIPSGTIISKDFSQVESIIRIASPTAEPIHREDEPKRQTSEEPRAIPGGTQVQPNNQSETPVNQAVTTTGTTSTIVKCECGKHLKCDHQYAGRYAQCTGCGRLFLIPRGSANVPPSLPNNGAAVSPPSASIKKFCLAARRQLEASLVGKPIKAFFAALPQSVSHSRWLIILGGLTLCSAIIVGISLVVLPAVGRQPGGVRSIPGVKAILGNAPSPEWEVVKRYVLRNSLRPESITFEKWFPAKDASPEDDNAFEIKWRQDHNATARVEELTKLIDAIPVPTPPRSERRRMAMEDPRYEGYRLFDRARFEELNRRAEEIDRRAEERYQEELNEYEKKTGAHKTERGKLQTFREYKEMTADRVVRVITRTDAPILGLLRTDDFYYLKDGKVVKCKTGTPADQDELINLYYPGED
jgi:hypothetical protein